MDRETAIRKRIARTVVDDGDESARTGGAAKVAVCMYEEQKRKSRFKSVQLYSCSVHAMEYLYEYIYIAQDDNTTAVAWLKAGFLFLHIRSFALLVLCVYVAINKPTLCSAQSFVVWWPLQQ